MTSPASVLISTQEGRRGARVRRGISARGDGPGQWRAGRSAAAERLFVEDNLFAIALYEPCFGLYRLSEKVMHDVWAKRCHLRRAGS